MTRRLREHEDAQARRNSASIHMQNTQIDTNTFVRSRADDSTVKTRTPRDAQTDMEVLRGAVPC
ncbi:hypothetical protein AKJ09_00837 [Labilithrix luteola]|uniref:Uncharacterized protein n=1 Tax=Labilithrix luteola TaxID=1391654 RepID=A0A0K1PKV6_9BACT|nr:hypothetical protein AKJ09_00837 [Labilithrix luteola]